MRKSILSVVAVLAGAGTALAFPRESSGPVQPARPSVTCFKTGEETSGQNKICFYNCLGSEAAITISSVSICPITINR